MINPSKASKFAEWRKLNPNAPIRHFDASRPLRPSKYPGADSRVICQGQYRFVVTIVPDEDADIDYLGTFTNTYDFPRTLKRRTSVRSGEYTCFRPAITVAEDAEAYNRAGHSRAESYALALETAYEVMDRAESYGYRWDHVGVCVRAYAAEDTEHERELAYASLWSVESDSEREYFDEIARDLIAECLDSIGESREKQRPIW